MEALIDENAPSRGHRGTESSNSGDPATDVTVATFEIGPPRRHDRPSLAEHMGRTPAPFADPAWAWEVKFDGYRMLAFREGKRARLMSRSGRDSSVNFPEVLQALMPLSIDCVLDCELTIPDAHGRPESSVAGEAVASRVTSS